MKKPFRPLNPQTMGRKGAAARFAALTPEQRSDLARKAAQSRWKKARENQ